MTRDDLRRWAEARRTAEAREREEARRGDVAPDAAIASALALIALVARLQGWPPPEDEASRREDERTRDAWSRLRAAYGRP